MQQIKEHGKNHKDKTNEEEMGSLPGKKFWVIILKMIQNLENKMEAWINRLEAQIEKMKEMINKDPEELKNGQLAMNNTITEMKNTLEWTNSRVTEAEEWINELEDRMVQITATEQNMKF